jgi:murein DD-endopeptidase MepM/ murein hydrolase activator NlpD
MDERPKIKILKKGIPKKDIPTAPRPNPKDAIQTDIEKPAVQEKTESNVKPETSTENLPTTDHPYRSKKSSSSSKYGSYFKWGLIQLGIVLLTAFVCYMIWGNKNESGDTNLVNQSEVSGKDQVREPDVYNIARNKGYLSKKDILRERSEVRDFLRQLGVPDADAKFLSREAYKSGLGRLEQGDKYNVYHDSLNVKEVKFILVETKRDPQYYFIFNRDEDVLFERFEKMVVVRETSTAVIIEDNLAKTFNVNKLDNTLVVYLENAYKWTFDFFDLKDGDRFKMIYEREFINGTPGQIKKMKSMYFEVGEEKHYAFNFGSGRTEKYYNDQAQESKNAFLKSPIAYGGIITSGYGLRTHPVYHTVKEHLGTDYAAPSGTEIQAVADGVVIEAQERGNNGNYVKIRHDGTYETQYLHMRDLPLVRRGDRVKQGEIIGLVGSTGASTGPHVCFRFWKNKKQVNHLTENITKGKGSSLDRKLRNEFDRFANEQMAKLEAVDYF